MLIEANYDFKYQSATLSFVHLDVVLEVATHILFYFLHNILVPFVVHFLACYLFVVSLTQSHEHNNQKHIPFKPFIHIFDQLKKTQTCALTVSIFIHFFQSYQ